MVKVNGKAVRIRKKDGQRVKNELRELGVLDAGRSLDSDEKYVYLPVVGGSEGKLEGYEVIEVKLEVRRKKKGFRELLVDKFGEEIEGVLSSYDVVGDIAIVQIPKGFEKHESEIGELLLKGEGKVKVVLKKAGGRGGEFRVTKLAHLAGEVRTETEYVENGVRMKLDISRVYFSPRLSNERKRIRELVGEEENVLVLFAGVGPFALVIGKANPSCKVAGVELNPDAVSYFEENILLNKSGNVEAFLGDVKDVVPKKFTGWADRIAMPLPMGAEEFLDSAFLAARPGCVVHFYRMVEKSEGVERLKKRIEEGALKAGKKVEFVFEKEVRPYSASTVQYVLDFKVV